MAPNPRSEPVLTAVLLGVCVGLAFVGQNHWRIGLTLLGGVLLAAAVLRVVLPARRLGLLVVRSRPFDAALLVALGLALVLLTYSVPLPSR